MIVLKTNKNQKDKLLERRFNQFVVGLPEEEAVG